MNLDEYVIKIDAAGALPEKQKIIIDALSDNEIHVFGEFLNHPNLSNLAQEDPKLHQMLQLFAYGTYSDYISQPEQYHAMSDSQVRKLRRLSIVQAARTQRNLPYSQLLSSLGLANVPELESLVIEMVTLGVLEGKLDQRNQQLHVHSTLGRDVPLSELPRLIESLEVWADSCRQSLGLVCSQMEAAEKRRADSQASRRQLEERLETDRLRMQREQPFLTNANTAPSDEAASQAAASSSSSSTTKPQKKVKLSAKK